MCCSDYLSCPLMDQRGRSIALKPPPHRLVIWTYLCVPGLPALPCWKKIKRQVKFEFQFVLLTEQDCLQYISKCLHSDRYFEVLISSTTYALDYRRRRHCDRAIRCHGHRGGVGYHCGRGGNDHLAQEALGEMSRHRHQTTVRKRAPGFDN